MQTLNYVKQIVKFYLTQTTPHVVNWIREGKHMGKKILVVSSSPRRGGNSDLLCDDFVKGAQEAGHNVEKIFLADKHINYCKGCEVCDSTSECIQQDDMQEILDKVVDSAVIVPAAPIYFNTPCAQMKTFIDRCVPRYLDIKNKEFYYIITAADTMPKNMDRALSSFRGFTLDCLEGTKESGILYGLGVWHKGEVKGSALLADAYNMGKNA